MRLYWMLRPRRESRGLTARPHRLQQLGGRKRLVKKREGTIAHYVCPLLEFLLTQARYEQHGNTGRERRQPLDELYGGLLRYCNIHDQQEQLTRVLLEKRGCIFIPRSYKLKAETRQ